MRSIRKTRAFLFVLTFALGGIIFISGAVIAILFINKIPDKVLAIANQWVIEKDAVNSSLKFYYNDQAPSMTISTAGRVTATSFAGDGSALTNVGGVPSGAVMFFNSTVCPSGWSELTSARGRYIVGLPLSGTLGGTAGTALTNLENRSVGQHNHFISDPGHFHYFNHITGYGLINPFLSCCGSWNLMYNPSWGTLTTLYSTTNISIQNSGSVAGTNAPYLQLLACQKT